MPVAGVSPWPRSAPTSPGLVTPLLSGSYPMPAVREPRGSGTPARLAKIDVIEVEDRLQVDEPVDRPEDRVPLEKVGLEGEIRRQELRLAAAEEVEAPRVCRAVPVRHRKRAVLGNEVRRRRQPKEHVLALDRDVPLQGTLPVIVPEFRVGMEIGHLLGVARGVASPRLKTEAPAVGHGMAAGDGPVSLLALSDAPRRPRLRDMDILADPFARELLGPCQRFEAVSRWRTLCRRGLDHDLLHRTAWRGRCRGASGRGLLGGICRE